MNPAQMDLFLGGEDEEIQDPIDLPQPDEILEVRANDDGSASVVELVAGADGRLEPRQGASPRRFATLDGALHAAGRTGAREDGTFVAVLLDGELIW